tara:strand:- start:1678 stop:2088 length:411 start_codon:yes stop_codon:yes gene_type:complete
MKGKYMNNNKLPKDFIVSDEYCVIEPGLTKFNKDQIISHADLLDYLKDDVATINDLSLLPHMSDTKKVDLDKEYEKLSDKVSTLLDNTESEMNDLIEKFNEKVEEDEDNESYQEIDTTDLSYKFSELSDYIEDYSQ